MRDSLGSTNMTEHVPPNIDELDQVQIVRLRRVTREIDGTERVRRQRKWGT